MTSSPDPRGLVLACFPIPPEPIFRVRVKKALKTGFL
jgi:hypothetical protein